MTYHQFNGQVLACDECGCAVASGERERAAHAAWHEGRDALVVDLSEARGKVDLVAAELRRVG